MTKFQGVQCTLLLQLLAGPIFSDLSSTFVLRVASKFGDFEQQRTIFLNNLKSLMFKSQLCKMFLK